VPDVVRILAQLARYPEVKTFAEDAQEEYDYNYIEYKLEGRHLQSLSHVIHGQMMGAVASVNNILNVLTTLRKSSAHYPQLDAFGNEIPDSSKMTPLFKVNANGHQSKICLSIAFIEQILQKDNDYTNLMRKSIEKTFHAHTRPRKIVTGSNYLYEGTRPQFLKTMQLQPNPNHILTIVNTNYKTPLQTRVYEGKQTNDQPFHYINRDYEETAFEHHWYSCQYPDGFADQFYPRIVEQMVQQSQTYRNQAQQATYPDDYIRQDQQRKNVLRNKDKDRDSKLQLGTYNITNQVGYKRKRA